MLFITAIVPVYNVSEYLEDFIDSIQNQSLASDLFEVIFIDDRSTDDSLLIIQKNLHRLSNTKVIKNNVSSGAAGKPRNQGLLQAKGEYVVFWDPDDIIPRKALEIFYENSLNSKPDILAGSFFTYFEENKKFVNSANQPSFTFDNKELIIKNTESENIYKLIKLGPRIWVKAYKRKMLVNNNITQPEKVFGQDAVFNIETILKAERIKILPDFTYIYRIRSMDSESKSATQQNTLRYFNDFLVTRKLLLNMNKFDYSSIRKSDSKFITKRLYSLAMDNRRLDSAVFKKFKDLYTLLDFKSVNRRGLFNLIVFFSIKSNSPIAINLYIKLKSMLKNESV